MRARLALATVGAMVASAAAAAPAHAADDAEIYVIHGVPGVVADVSVGGEVIETDASPMDVVGPIAVSAGEHEVSLMPTSGEGVALTSTVSVDAGESVDVVAHRTADADAGPVVTVFPNDTSPVGPGKARVVVAHTAAVPPADIRVDGDVLFSNVANAESLALEVTAGTYAVDIVPTGVDGPVVFGPVDLPVEAGTLTRVFAIGDPDDDTMEAAVQVIQIETQGSAVPEMVQTGTGGQAAELAGRSQQVVPPTLAGAGALLLAGAVVMRRRVVRAQR